MIKELEMYAAITKLQKIHSDMVSGFILAIYGALIVENLAKKLQIPKDDASMETGKRIMLPQYATLKALEIPNLLPRTKIEKQRELEPV